jgi:hypothetical protein
MRSGVKQAVAYYTRRFVVENHDDPRIDLPPLSISTLIRLEKGGIYTSARYSGPNSPAYLSDDDIRAIRNHCRNSASP